MKRMNNFEDKVTKESANTIGRFKAKGFIPLRTAAILGSAFFVVAAIPLFSAGHPADVSLQVPSEFSQTQTSFTPVSDDFEILSDRNSDSDVTDTEKVPTTVTEEQSKLNQIISSKTVVISETNSDSGVPVELLDTSKFEDDNTTVYSQVDGANIRKAPKESGELLGTLGYGDTILRTGVGTSWSKVALAGGGEGYILSEFLTTSYVAKPTPTPTEAPKAETKADTSDSKVTNTSSASTAKADVAAAVAPAVAKATVSETPVEGTFYAVGIVNVRSGPGTDYSVTRTLSLGDGVDVVAKTDNGWYRTVKDTYVLAQLFSASKPEKPVEDKGSENTEAPASDDFASFVRQFVGVPYVWAGASPSGFDCSGLVSYVYSNYYGISLPHLASSIAGMGTAVDAASIQVGDVICYDFSGDGVVDHVSLYVGGGAIVHASSSRQRVAEGGLTNNSVTSIRRFL